MLDLPDIPLLGFSMDSKSVYHKGICTSAFIRDFKFWNQATCPLTMGHRMNTWHIDPTECFSAIKKDTVMLPGSRSSEVPKFTNPLLGYKDSEYHCGREILSLGLKGCIFLSRYHNNVAISVVQLPFIHPFPVLSGN